MSPREAAAHKMGDEGLEPTPDSPTKTRIQPEARTKARTVGADSDPHAPRLRAVVDAWSGLSEATKASILAIIHGG